MNLQLAGSVHEGFITETVERLGIAGRRDDGRATDQFAGRGVFEDEEIALFTVEADFGGEGGFACGDLVAQAFNVIRQEVTPIGLSAARRCTSPRSAICAGRITSMVSLLNLRTYKEKIPGHP
jgi:hypothetical protein